MTPPRSLPLALVLLALLCACSGDTVPATSEQKGCAKGQEVDPITGMCQRVSTGTPDMNALQDKKDGGGGDSRADMRQLPPGDMAQTGLLDLAGLPDMRSLGPEDMTGELLPDMAPQEKVVRFLAIGDTGEGSATQRKVGQAMGTVCQQAGGCEFALLLGDNAYDSGVKSVDDPLFDDVFVTPYGHLPFPFYVVLGNHDLGGDGLGIDRDFKKGDYQVEYATKNPQWLMPAKYYQADKGSVWLLGLNTTDIFFDRAKDQKQEVTSWIQSAPPGAWKVAFGHHPFISNGKHGNAGEYEGLPFIPIANGEHVEDFMTSTVCGKVDFYVCGHDHSLQDLKARCGTEFVVSGAGAKTTDVKSTKNPAYFQSKTVGFVMFEATKKTMKLTFYDEDQKILHQRTVTR